MRFLLFVAFFSCFACGVPRQRHAAALRELELARGRLSDVQRKSRENEAALKEELTQALLKAEEAESRRDSALAELSQWKTSLAEAISAVGEALLTGSIEAGGLDPEARPMSALRLKSEELFTTNSQGALSLTSQGEERLREVAALLVGTKGKVFILGHEDGAPDNLAASATLALRVARALHEAGVPLERLSLVALGAAQPLCTRDRSLECVAENRRVEIILLPGH